MKDIVCTWCGATSHIENMCHSEANGFARGGKSGGGRGQGKCGRGKGGDYSSFGEEELEQGCTEVRIGEVNMGTRNGDREEKEWVCDGGEDSHMTGDVRP